MYFIFRKILEDCSFDRKKMTNSDIVKVDLAPGEPDPRLVPHGIGEAPDLGDSFG